MQDIEQTLRNGAYRGILYDLKYNISPEIKEEILKRVSLIKDRIKIISNRFALERESLWVTKRFSVKFFLVGES